MSDCLYFLKYWAICVSQLFVNRAVTSWNLKLTLSFLSSHFCYTTKKSRQKLTYLENEKSFRGEIKDIFIIFKGLSVLKNCLGPESVPLKQKRLDLKLSNEKYIHIVIFTGKRQWFLVQRPFSTFVGSRAYRLRKRLLHLRCFLLKLVKVYRMWFLQKTAEQLLLFRITFRTYRLL